MWNGPLEKIDDYRFRIPRSYRGESGSLKMRADGIIYADETMLEQLKNDNAPEQVANVTTLPGLVGNSLAMPDIHWGYGFPIGGVAATDAEEGVISPGGVGFDINCGVRLLRTNLHASDLTPARIKEIIDAMFVNVPSGLGSKGRVRLEWNGLEEVLRRGAAWAVESGYGRKEDLACTEENGCMESAEPSKVSADAKKRGAPQLGSLGAGNHFLELQTVDEIMDPRAAKIFGVDEPGQIMVMIHTGSRGCGHQICTDHLKIFERAVDKYGIKLPDRQLACAPVDSKEAQDYFSAMACGVNFAFANRQMITHWVRESFEEVFRRPAGDMGLDVVYDVCHNIAKLEEHVFEGNKRKVYVHRKGATRAFGPDRSEVPARYRDVGQPVIIPGDMGTCSYLLKGTEKAMAESWGSTCHGAGRTMSRHEAMRRWSGDSVVSDLRKKGIYVHAADIKVAAEESPNAYKDVNSVVNITHGAGISMKVARMKPLGVVKG
ncbi:MAG: RNA-splicing ligase RtcB [Thermoplasmata archaeon HGW-Thermoplasmata-1]|nr:MAG: RNA-splicing ligase RtcB [Thermoplasmata archaeon HGW-Thermoplasmata-1]